MTGILTPSECAKLSELLSGVRDGRVKARIVEAFPSMLATIAAHEATIADLRNQLRAQDNDMKAWKENE